MIEWGMVDLKRYENEIQERKNHNYGTLSGDEGTCFIEDDEILKIYWHRYFKEGRCDFTKYTSDRIAFPKYYIQDTMFYYGEVMTYFPFKEVDKAIDLNTNIKELMKHYYIIENEISKFPNIHMTDLNFSGNILFSKEKGFYLIDTTCWDDEEWSYTQKANMRKFDGSLFEILCNLTEVEFLKNKDEVLNSYESIKNSNVGKEFLEILEANLRRNYQFLEFLISFQNVIRDNFNKDIKNIGDIKKYNKKLKGL